MGGRTRAPRRKAFPPRSRALHVNPRSDAATLAALGARVDFHECIPCGGACCRTPWTVFASPRDLARLEQATGRSAREFAKVAPLPEWERDAFGEDNLLFPRVAAASGDVPQLAKRADGACTFLDERGLCGVHASKPLLCRLYPFYYETPPFRAHERPSPLYTEGAGLRLLVDRGHEGRCPITPERMAVVEKEAGDALVALCRAFEDDVAAYETEKEAFVARWKAAFT